MADLFESFGYRKPDIRILVKMTRFNSLTAFIALLGTSAAYATILYVGVNEVRAVSFTSFNDEGASHTLPFTSLAENSACMDLTDKASLEPSALTTHLRTTSVTRSPFKLIPISTIY